MFLSVFIYFIINKRKNLGWREGCYIVVCFVSFKEFDGILFIFLIVYIEIDLWY